MTGKILDRSFTVQRNNRDLKLVKGEAVEEWTAELVNDSGKIQLKGYFPAARNFIIKNSVRVRIEADQEELPIKDEQPTAYKCKYCGETFDKPLELAHHVRKVHKKGAEEK